MVLSFLQHPRTARRCTCNSTNLRLRFQDTQPPGPAWWHALLPGAFATVVRQGPRVCIAAGFSNRCHDFKPDAALQKFGFMDLFSKDRARASDIQPVTLWLESLQEPGPHEDKGLWSAGIEAEASGCDSVLWPDVGDFGVSPASGVSGFHLLLRPAILETASSLALFPSAPLLRCTSPCPCPQRRLPSTTRTVTCVSANPMSVL